MVLLDDVKPLKIYKRPMFLPTLEDDKKKKSVIYLLTPNYESSKNLMTSDLIINKNRFQSYYIEKDLTYFISSKVMGKLEDVAETYVRNYTETDFYHSLCEMKYADRQKMKAKDFALPKQKKWPIHDKEHILDCIKYFNYVKREDEEELARNLNKAIDKHFGPGEWPNCGKKNRFKKYYKHAHEMNPMTEAGLLEFNFFKSTDNLEFNMENLETGRNKVLYITGYSGAGKSTTMNKIRDSYGNSVETIEFDILTVTLIRRAKKYWEDPDRVRNNPLIFEYLFEKGIDKGNFGFYKNFDDPNLISVYYDFCNWLETKSKTTDFNNRIIAIEGTQIARMCDEDSNFFDDKPVIIIGTSAIISYARKQKRDVFSEDKWKKNPKKLLLLFKSMDIYTNMTRRLDKLVDSLSEATVYDPPLSYDKLPDHLKNDEVHAWRAKTGIELIHKEPTIEEMERIWNNWNAMTDEQKSISDKKSIELFGMDNCTHYWSLAKEYVPVNNPTGRRGINRANLQESVLNENILFNAEDIYYNKDKFDSGEINLCFIIGHSGSGKSTMGKYMSKEDNIETCDMDLVIYSWRCKNSAYKNLGGLAYNFFQGPGKKYIVNSDEEFNNKPKGFVKEMTKEFFDFAVQYANFHKNTKFVIEGVWMMMYMEPQYFDNCAVYIKGASMIISKYRADKRDAARYEGNNTKNFIEKVFRQNSWKYFIKREVDLKKFVEYFENKTQISESVLNENIIVPTKDIEHDLDKWKVGKKNILFVTGLSGSGKSTKAAELSKANNAINIEIDLFEHNSILFDPKNVEQDEGNLIIKEYFEKKFGGKKKWKHYYYSENYGEEMALFLRYIIEYAKTHADRLFVVEGIQILKLGGKIRDEVLECPIIVINTTLIKSIMQAIKRSGGLDGYFGKRGEWNIESFEDFKRWLNWYSDMEKNRANFIDVVKDIEEDTTLQKVGKALQNNKFENPLSAIGRKAAESKSGQFGLKIGELIRDGKDKKKELNEGAYQIRKDGGFIDPDGIFNSIVLVDGSNKRLRGRGEMIILSQDRKKILLPIKNGVIKLPGGSFEKNERHMDTAIRETKEEIRVKVKDVFDPDINYIVIEPVHDWVREKIPEDKWWDGSYTEVFVGTYDGQFKGKVEDHDADIAQLKGTKWYKLDQTILNSLRQEHRDAIEMYINRDLQEACKDVDTARKFVSDVQKIAKKYDANFFLVTDGASGYSNGNGKSNPAVKNARNCQIEWEKENGFDPDEDWRKDGTFKEGWTHCPIPGLEKYEVPSIDPDEFISIDVDRKDIEGPATEDDITCTGYLEDLNVIRSLATKNVYNWILEEAGLIFDKIPHINIVATQNQTMDWYNINENGIEIYVDSNSEDRMSVEEFSNHILRTMITSLIEYKYPNLSNTILPYSIAEYITFGNGELNSFLENYLSKKSYLDLYMETENLNSNELFKFVRLYGENGIEYEEDLLTEKKTITADGLIRSLKYRGRAKLLKKSHKIKNQTSDLLDKIKSDTQPKGFKPPSTPGSSSTKPVEESAIKYITDALDEGSYIESGEYLTILEDSTYDSNLKKILYTERMIKNKDAIALLDRAKEDMPFIKYTYLDISRYQQKNLFVDLYYYNQAFFKNNTFKDKKGFGIYKELLDRLINDKRIDKVGYTRKTVFIPINDWHINKDTKMWMFKEDLNPISIIYQLLMTDSNSLKRIFKDTTAVFFGNNNYFTIDFNDTKNSKSIANKFKNFIIKINKNEEFEPEDEDSVISPSKKAIKADVLDKIEASKGVDLTPATSNKKDSKEDIRKAAYSDDDFYYKDASYKKYYKDILDKIDLAVDNANDTEEALDNMDDDLDLKELIAGLDGNDDAVNINQARASRMSELDKELLDKSIHGRNIRDILKEEDKEEKEIPATKLDIASPNEEWKEMRYMNFDSTYDMEKDIINAFRHWSNVSRPLSIRNIKAENNSTSEDRLDLYTVDYEDYRGKRYTIKLDIPRIKRNRFLLRGNEKNIQTQFFNMPIIKTDLNTAQIVTNYKKIIMYRYNTVTGRSLPNTSRLMKALNKYDGTNIKITKGFNERICNKYDLPIDYIDLSSVYTTIETNKCIIYFNQDEIRKLYDIDESEGIPYGYYKKTKEVMYLSNKGNTMFVDVLIGILVEDDNKFSELFKDAKPTNRCTYTKARIMGSDIPLIIVCSYSEGLSKVLKKANVQYSLVDKLTQEIRHDLSKDYIRFNDGYLVYTVTYDSSLLLNGFKECDTLSHSLAEIDDRNMYLEFLDNYGGRIKSDGLDNFYDCELDPITMENLVRYNLPTDYISVLLYANYLLADNKYIKHTDMSSRRTRRYEIIAAYTYQVMSEAYGTYANSLKHSRNQVPFTCKQSAVIDKIMTDPTLSDYSTNSILGDIEATNALTAKGLSGMNSDDSYSLDKRVFDKSMLGVAGMSTGFSANVGITRQSTLDMSIEGNRGYVKDTKGNSTPNTAKMLTATEAVVPMMTTHDDPTRVAMSFVQTAKHSMRTEESDPLLVTNGADEALCYICSDEFVHKAKGKGTVTSLTPEDMIITYEDGTKEFVDLKEQIKKNSDGGFYESLKLDVEPKIKVGSKVKQGQIVAFDKYSVSNSLGESDNYAANIGKIAKVAIINCDEAFEDSGAIIEKTAHDLACRVIVKEECNLDKNTNIYNIVSVGTNIEQGDPLLIWQTPYDEEEVNALLKALVDDTEAVNELGRHAVKSEYTGKVVGMKVYRTVEIDELSDSLKKLVRQYEKPINELQKRLKQEGIEDEVDLPANYALSPTGKLKGTADGVKIEFYVEYVDIVGVGDKITYNAANKAVIAKVIPEGKEPTTDFRPNEPISAIISVTSIQKRMVQSTITYGALQKLMIELDRTCKDMAGIPYDDSKI